MKYALYTGCVAKGAGKELLIAVKLVAKKLGITLHEMTDAACCGAGVISEDNPMVADILNARTFALAEKLSLPIMNICATCQGVHSKALLKFKEDKEYLNKVNDQLEKSSNIRFSGNLEVHNFYYLLLHDFGLEKLKKLVTNPLKGLKVAPFYGCYTLRPHESSDVERPDNPDELEKIIRALGGEPVEYEERLKCCGFPIVMMNKLNALKLGANAVEGAKSNGADILVTPCPLCQLSLDAYQPDHESLRGKKFKLPILHLPQLVALALGVSRQELKLSTHIVRPNEAVMMVGN
ncbi:MAG: CoB--CoM heterodisulfide reductase iron-sulfur subunit B family protein [Nitrospinota bacterium]